VGFGVTFDALLDLDLHHLLQSGLKMLQHCFLHPLPLQDLNPAQPTISRVGHVSKRMALPLLKQTS
jgi:hypothetical protein